MKLDTSGWTAAQQQLWDRLEPEVRRRLESSGAPAALRQLEQMLAREFDERGSVGAGAMTGRADKIGPKEGEGPPDGDPELLQDPRFALAGGGRAVTESTARAPAVATGLHTGELDSGRPALDIRSFADISTPVSYVSSAFSRDIEQELKALLRQAPQLRSQRRRLGTMLTRVDQLCGGRSSRSAALREQIRNLMSHSVGKGEGPPRFRRAMAALSKLLFHRRFKSPEQLQRAINVIKRNLVQFDGKASKDKIAACLLALSTDKVAALPAGRQDQIAAAVLKGAHVRGQRPDVAVINMRKVLASPQYRRLERFYKSRKKEFRLDKYKGLTLDQYMQKAFDKLGRSGKARDHVSARRDILRFRGVKQQIGMSPAQLKARRIECTKVALKLFLKHKGKLHRFSDRKVRMFARKIDELGGLKSPAGRMILGFMLGKKKHVPVSPKEYNTFWNKIRRNPPAELKAFGDLMVNVLGEMSGAAGSGAGTVTAVLTPVEMVIGILDMLDGLGRMW